MAKSSHCVVTGGAGFIGSHLVDALIREGWKVTILDNLSTGSAENLACQKGRVEIICGDLRDPKAVAKAVAGATVVFHLAALSSHRLGLNRPMLLNDVNVGGTVNLLQQTVKAGVGRLVFASSAAVYGEPERLPVRENDPTNPTSPYGASKLAGEKYCRAFQSTYALETVCLRYFNVYGARQRAGAEAAVVPEFLSRIETGKPLTIHGSGRQIRDFVYVEDVVDATTRAARMRRASGEVLNIGTGKATSVLGLANQLMASTGGFKLPKAFKKPRLGDIFRSCADTTRAKEVLGYEPKTHLEEGLRTLTRSTHVGMS